MPENIEIKARVRDWESLKKKAEEICGTPAEVLQQEDTFFEVKQNRLKLRVFSDHQAELIYYRKEDIPGPKRSDYQIVPIKHPAKVKAMLSQALGIRGTVIKSRTVFKKENVRIHLDEVEGLGRFVEIEVVLGSNHDRLHGEKSATQFMEKLGITETDLLEKSYIDMLEKSSRPQES
jgi:predicted adenylyl cyclase CyaB